MKYIILLFSFLITACATDPPVNSLSIEKLVQEAKESMSVGDYAKTIEFYEKIESRSIDPMLLQQTKLNKAYAYYKQSDAPLARSTLEQFIKLHPSSPSLDYAWYLLGLTSFNEDQGLIAKFFKFDLTYRDERSMRLAYDAFLQLVEKFPNSRYKEDASSRINYIITALAQSQLGIARFYLKKGAFIAAIARAQDVLLAYNQTTPVEDALLILIECYDQLNDQTKRDDVIRIYALNFPQRESNFQAPKWWIKHLYS